MNRWLARSVLYPLHERLRGRPTYPILRRLEAHDALDAGGLAAERDTRARGLVRHAADRVPFWREWFAREGLEPSAITGAADLARLPTMDKPLIRRNLERLVAESHRDRVFRLETGGSSGQPLIFYTDNEREASQLAARLRARGWWGIRNGDNQVDLWGSPIELRAQDRARQIKDRLLNFRVLSAFALSDESMAAFRGVLEHPPADLIYGYASVLARYARFLEARGESLTHLPLKAAITTAEILFPDQKEDIERVFGCPVANEYGCRDGGFIAHTCPEGGLHLAEDVLFVEILRDDGSPASPGEVGEIAVTNLYSHGMPLIRYRIGDRAARSPGRCACGRPYPLLESLQGRVTDTLVTPDGNRVHGLGVMYVIRVLEGVDRYQVIQDEPDHVEVLIVPAAGAQESRLLDPVREGVRKVLGERMRIDVRLVDDIETTASGKMRSIWNRLGG